MFLSRSLRSFLKDLMIVISTASLLINNGKFFFSKNKKKTIIKFRTGLILIGFIVGPVIGCGLTANFYFKDNYREEQDPINIQEFGA